MPWILRLRQRSEFWYEEQANNANFVYFYCIYETRLNLYNLLSLSFGQGVVFLEK